MKKEIFRVGRWTDSAGNSREWTESDLDSIVKTFSAETGRNTNGHEVPLTPGHPKDDTPALGVVKKLWRDGKSLWAEFMDIKDEVLSLIKDKTFRDVSIALKEGVLRHVGLTNIPAVPGLTAFKFADTEFETWEFSEEDESGLFKRFSQWLVNHPVADQVKLFQQEKVTMPKLEELEKKISDLEGKFAVQGEEVKTLKADKAALEAEKAEAEKKYSDAEAELKKLKSERAAEAEKAMDAEDAAFAEQMIKEGRLVPAQKEVTLMSLKSLRGQAEQEFAEGVKQTPVEHYKFVMKTSPKVVEFGQYFKGEKNDKGTDKLDILTNQKLAELRQTDPTANYSQAADIVASLHPELLKGE